jgi:hypothetical protein
MKIGCHGGKQVKKGWKPYIQVIQEESAILWEMIVCVILSKKVHMNMGPIYITCIVIRMVNHHVLLM